MKRFQVTVDDSNTVTLKEVQDYGTWEFITISFKTFKDANDCAIALAPICNRLNAIYEDNIELNKLLDSVENIIKASIHDEKTAFGQMILKQLADNLGVDYE
ncbi:hypothetical protein [Methanobrevibacter sp.]|uniref:hypothetical protein n=1 Tax=Methanobrevibacter sp. TaxID=66852 RepID=UPI003862DADC